MTQAPPPSPPPSPPSEPALSQPVEEVMALWPQTLAVFLKRRMACPGCAMARFQTVADAAEAYGIEATALLAEIGRAAAGAPPAGPFPAPRPHRREG